MTQHLEVRLKINRLRSRYKYAAEPILFDFFQETLRNFRGLCDQAAMRISRVCAS
jgi:hypothetical protein